MSKSKVTEHPYTRFVKEIEEQGKKIVALEIDVSVLRDLLLRTVRMLARSDVKFPEKGPWLLK